MNLCYHLINAQDRRTIDLRNHQSTIANAAKGVLGNLFQSLNVQQQYFQLTLRSMPKRKLLTDMGKEIVANDPVLNALKKTYAFTYSNGNLGVSTQLFRRFNI